jgi:hypothetical protein
MILDVIIRLCGSWWLGMHDPYEGVFGRCDPHIYQGIGELIILVSCFVT